MGQLELIEKVLNFLALFLQAFVCRQTLSLQITDLLLELLLRWSLLELL